MEYTQGELLKSRFAANLLSSNIHFDTDQLREVLDICDRLGIPEMYEILRQLVKSFKIAAMMVNLSEHLVAYELSPAQRVLQKAEGQANDKRTL